MSTFGEGSHVGEETAVPVICRDQQQLSIGQVLRLLGRPKYFSGCEDEWHDWNLKFGATAATLSDHANVLMNGALQHTTEITLDQPDEASALIFARQMHTLFILMREGRSLAIVRGALDHNCLEGWRLLHELYQSKTRSKGALLSEILGGGCGTKEQKLLQRMKDWRMRRWSTTELQVRQYKKICLWLCKLPDLRKKIWIPAYASPGSNSEIKSYATVAP